MTVKNDNNLRNLFDDIKKYKKKKIIKFNKKKTDSIFSFDKKIEKLDSVFSFSKKNKIFDNLKKCKKKIIIFTSKRKNLKFQFFEDEEEKIIIKKNFKNNLILNNFDNDIDSETDVVKDAIWKNFTILQKMVFKKN